MKPTTFRFQDKCSSNWSTASPISVTRRTKLAETCLAGGLQSIDTRVRKKKTFQIFTCKKKCEKHVSFLLRVTQFFLYFIQSWWIQKGFGVMRWRHAKNVFWSINTFVRYCQLLRKNKTWWQCPLVAGLSKWNLYSGTGQNIQSSF